MKNTLSNVPRNEPDLAPGRSWVRSLAIIPGAVLPFLPSATCPACLAAYAGVLSSLGLGFLHDERVMAPLIGGFLLIGVASIAYATKTHRRVGPLLAALVGSAGIVAGRLVWSIPILLYGGVALLIVASLWNLWLKRPRRVVDGDGVSVEQCSTGGCSPSRLEQAGGA